MNNQKIQKMVRKYIKNTRGANMVEYIVIAALILLVAIVAVGAIGTKLNAKAEAVSGAL